MNLKPSRFECLVIFSPSALKASSSVLLGFSSVKRSLFFFCSHSIHKTYLVLILEQKLNWFHLTCQLHWIGCGLLECSEGFWSCIQANGGKFHAKRWRGLESVHAKYLLSLFKRKVTWWKQEIASFRFWLWKESTDIVLISSSFKAWDCWFSDHVLQWFEYSISVNREKKRVEFINSV